MPQTTLVWFRHSLRLADNPALHAAAEHGAVVPVFVWAPDEEGDWPPGQGHRWWLHRSLGALDDRLRARDSRLVLRTGPTEEALMDLVDATGADAVYWNRRYEPPLMARDRTVRTALKEQGVETRTYESQILHDPDGVETTSGGSYHVYTPFWNKVTGEDLLRVGTPLDAPALGPSKAPDRWPESTPLEALGLEPDATNGTGAGREATWTPGEAAAHDRLETVLDRIVADYEDMRDRPDRDGTSRLSPRLHHGELSPRQVWHAVSDWAERHDAHEAAEPYLQEIVWREFSYHMLYHYPNTPTETYKDKFKDFGWRDHDEAFDRWKKGQTGYPIVDAGMRQLTEIGWMHNRVRMIVGSFLTKDLLVWWQRGARWFWKHLVDGDLASNTMGWQWSAGSGADAQPFFRIFNPVSQGERHDPDGAYVRRYVPELADLPAEHIHQPWNAPDDVLEAAGVTLGETYPRPIVDHSEARDQAMAEYDKVR
jgi:deoxyribodipyrimidine photo-lyase